MKKRKRRRRMSRMERMRRKRIRSTVLLLFLLTVLAGGGGFFLYTVKGGMMKSLNQPFSVVKEFSNPLVSGNKRQRSDLFAKNLCVVGGNITLDSSLLDTTEKGLLLDVTRKDVMFSQGAFDRVYPASITKLMTAILAFKYGNMSDTVTITQDDVTMEEAAQVCGFQPGDQVTMEQLLNCLLVYSGNDAASAIANHVGGSTAGFVQMMNSYAASLGCTGTHFTNPHGLHDPEHYTTPYDIYLILKEALNYPDFTVITQQPSYTVTYTRADGSQISTWLEATDHYLTGEAATPRDVKVLGGKTGYTSDAGNCLALLSQNAYGQPYVSVVMGADTKNDLYIQMNSLLQNINET